MQINNYGGSVVDGCMSGIHHHHRAVKDVGQCWPVPASESICQFLHRSAPISSSFWYILRY
jgi:hypothetical protein